MPDTTIVIITSADTFKKEEKAFANKDEVISTFKTEFKKLKFLKTRQTWKKNDGELTFICNIQNSQWSKDDYYVNCGVLINKLFYLPHNYGTIEIRADITGSATDIFSRVICWFEKYNTLNKIIIGCKNNEFSNESYCKMIINELQK